MATRKEDLKKVRGDFNKAVNRYREVFIDNFYCRRGDESDERPLEKKIIGLFQKSPSNPPDFRKALLSALRRKLSASVSARETGLNDPNDAARRLAESLKEMAAELVKKLKK